MYRRLIDAKMGFISFIDAIKSIMVFQRTIIKRKKKKIYTKEKQ